MKEKPILFSTEMVRAILDGRKTQTRRVVKPQPKTHHRSDTRLHFYPRTSNNWEVKDIWAGDCFSILDSFKCPYGKVGDLLWVRETFGQGVSGKFYYKADKGIADKIVLSWKPSIFMPKDAARIWLRITDVRVEKLGEITEGDAVAEGISIQSTGYYCWHPDESLVDSACEAGDAFRKLWQSINGHDSWNANPWVWVIEFEVLYKTGRP
jgi:hypothetical protein